MRCVWVQVVGLRTMPLSSTSPAVCHAPTTSAHRLATRPGGTSAKHGCEVHSAFASSSEIAPPGGGPSAPQQAVARPRRRVAGCGGALGAGAAFAGAGGATPAFAGAGASGISSNSTRLKSGESAFAKSHHDSMRRVYRRFAPRAKPRARVFFTVSTSPCWVICKAQSTPATSAPLPRGSLLFFAG